MRKRIATLKIENCRDCPHHYEEGGAPCYTGDSFDMTDTRIVCKKANNRVIDGCDRWRKRADTVVPDWCPLIVKRAERPSHAPNPERSTKP